jgi:hypothetical protein
MAMPGQRQACSTLFSLILFDFVGLFSVNGRMARS